MPKFRVDFEIITCGCVEVEADSEAEADARVSHMSKESIMDLGTAELFRDEIEGIDVEAKEEVAV